MNKEALKTLAKGVALVLMLITLVMGQRQFWHSGLANVRIGPLPVPNSPDVPLAMRDIYLAYQYKYSDYFFVFEFQSGGGPWLARGGAPFRELDKNTQKELEELVGKLPQANPWYRFGGQNLASLALLALILHWLVFRVGPVLRGMFVMPDAPQAGIHAAPVEAPPTRGLGLTSMSQAYADTMGVTLIHADDSPRDLKQTSEIFFETLGVSMVDASQYVRLNTGVIIARKLVQEVGEALVQAFDAKGVKVRLAQSDDLVSSALLARVNRVEYTQDKLLVTDAGGHQVEVAWKDIRLFTLAIIGEAQFNDSLRLHAGKGGLAPAFSSLKEEDMQAVLMTPQGQLRLQGNGVQYAHLGDRMHSSGLANFQTLLADLAERAFQAVRSPSFQAFLDHEASKIETFDRVASFEEDNQARYFRLS